MTTDDYHALMQRMGKQLRANEDMLRYAILNGLREDIAKYVIQKQPADMSFECIVGSSTRRRDVLSQKITVSQMLRSPHS